MKKISIKNPATGETIEELEMDSEAEIENKISKGDAAFKNWKGLDAHSRSKHLKKWYQLIQENRDEIARIITLESGKPLRESLGEVDYANDYIEWYAEEAKRIYGRTIPANNSNKKIIVSSSPVGLVAGITPWNFPAAMLTRKVAPALATGCTFVAKPALETPLTTIKLIELAHDAGIPENVLQYVITKGSTAGRLFTENNLVKKITFTGSTNVGKLLIADSAKTVKHVSMELGGHAPVIVHSDADLDKAVEQTIVTKFRNAGQTCISANRVIVHKDILEKFSNLLSEKVSQLKVGNGLNNDSDIGPVINESSYQKIVAQINDAINEGAQVISGNEFDINEEQGSYFIHPTILGKTTEDMLIMKEETFGPVLPLISYSSLEEAVEIANSTEFGLASYFFTNDYRVASFLHDELDFGVIGWNDGAPSAAHAPFGGMKESGVGREGGTEGIMPYLETKYLSIGV